MTELITPMFLDGSAGRLFALHFKPSGVPRGHIVYIPPLGEEMNRCRNLVATQAASFALAGYSCLVLDLFGTGDSEGELCDVSWEGWRQDVESGVAWLLSSQQCPVVLWGLRLGGLLALDLANSGDLQVQKLLLWQPVLNGKMYFTQVLRQRIANLVENGLPPETTDDMRGMLANGGRVEVAGYVFGSRLGADIDAIHASNFNSIAGVEILWCEQVTNSDKPLVPASQKLIAHLEFLGNEVKVIKHSSPPLWQLHKRDEANELLELTSGLFLD